MEKHTYTIFICKLIAFIIVFLVVDILFGLLCRELNIKASAKSPNTMITEYTMNAVKDDIIVIGASDATHSYVSSMLSDSLGMTAYNCGKDGNRFYYQNAMINGLLDRYSPKIIIWSITPYFLVTPDKSDDENTSLLNPFYSTNEFCKNAILRKSKFERIKMASQLYRYNSRLLYYGMALIRDYDYDRGYCPLFGYDKDMKLVEAERINYLDVESSKVFRETLLRCKQNGVLPVLVFTPTYRIDVYDDFSQYKELFRICGELDVPLIEDLYHPEKLMKKEYFKDCSHLNDEGAHIFTGMLIEKIDSIMVYNATQNVD